MKNLILKGFAVNFIILPFCLLDRVSSDLSVLWHTVIHIHADFSNKCSLTKFICWDALEYKSQNHLFSETTTKACTEIKKSPPHPASFKMTRIYALFLSLIRIIHVTSKDKKLQGNRETSNIQIGAVFHINSQLYKWELHYCSLTTTRNLMTVYEDGCDTKDERKQASKYSSCSRWVPGDKRRHKDLSKASLLKGKEQDC